MRVLNGADMKEKFFNAGALAIGSSPEELAAIIKADMARIGKVIKNAGIHADKLQISSGGLIRNSET